MSRKQPVSSETTTLQAVPDPAPSPDSIEQIRDIIFGTQMREYAERFGSLEKRLVDENRALQESLTSRIDEALESLDKERTLRKAGLDDLMDQLAVQSKELRDANDAIQQSFGDELDAVKHNFEQQTKNAESQNKGQLAHLGGLFRQLADQLDQN